MYPIQKRCAYSHCLEDAKSDGGVAETFCRVMMLSLTKDRSPGYSYYSNDATPAPT